VQHFRQGLQDLLLSAVPKKPNHRSSDTRTRNGRRGMRIASVSGMWGLGARVGAVAVASIWTAVTALAQAPSAPRFRSGVDLVTLDVCVTDRDGRFLPALKADDFLIFDGRARQQLAFFSAEGQVPLAAVVLIDRSSSMTGAKLERAKTAALTFLSHLGPADIGAVLAFNRQVMRVVPFSTGTSEARPLVDHLSADGQTALFDAMLVALRELQSAGRPGEGPRRDAIVVLSDGEDTASRLDFDDLRREVQRTGVLVYSISIRTDERDRPLPPLHEFSQLSWDSGGRAVAVRDLTTLDAVYADIAAELRQMYRLAYVPVVPLGDGGWHGVTVRVPTRDARVRTRAGYYAPSTSRPGGPRP
jgi:VWFA-related protein